MTVNHSMNANMYLKIFILLLILTLLTFVQPYIFPAQLMGTVMSQLFLAFLKTALIVAYYMHLKYETGLFKIIVLVAVVTLSIFFIITATDAFFRNSEFDIFK